MICVPQLKLPCWAQMTQADSIAQLSGVMSLGEQGQVYLEDGGCDAGVALLKVEEVVIEDLDKERDRGGVVPLEHHCQLLLR